MLLLKMFSTNLTAGASIVLCLACVLLPLSAHGQEAPTKEPDAQDLYELELSVARTRILPYEPLGVTITARSTAPGEGDRASVRMEDIVLPEASVVWQANGAGEEFRPAKDYAIRDLSSLVAPPSSTVSAQRVSSYPLCIWPSMPSESYSRSDSERDAAASSGPQVLRFYAQCSSYGRTRTYRSNTVEVEVVPALEENAAAVQFLEEHAVGILEERASPDWRYRVLGYGGASHPIKYRWGYDLGTKLLEQFPDSAYADHVRAAHGLVLCWGAESDEARAEAMKIIARAARYEGIPWFDHELSLLARSRLDVGDVETAVRLLRHLNSREPDASYTRQLQSSTGIQISTAEGGTGPRPTVDEVLEMFPEPQEEAVPVSE